MPSARCGSCAKFMSPIEGAKCSTCNLFYHRACGLLPTSGFINPTWSCPGCKNKVTKGCAVTVPEEVYEAEESMDTSALNCSTMGEASYDLPAVLRCFKDELRHMFKEKLRTELQTIKQEFQSEFQRLREDLAQLQAERDQTKGALELHGRRLDSFDSRMGALEQKISTVDGSVALQEVSQLKRELNDRDQQLLSNDLEISNLPESSSENLVHTVMLIATKLGLSVEERDVVSADRIGGRQLNATNAAGAVVTRPRTVVVRLVRRDLRDELLRAARVRRGATTADLGMTGPPCRFFCNERLTKTNRILFRSAREAGQRLGWQFVWTKHGRILARKKPGDKARAIRQETDLLEVFGPCKLP